MTQQDAINYWLTSAKQNLSISRDMIKTGHRDWALFMWHLVIEKMFKAIISQKGKTPLATHNLIKLSKQAELDLSDKYEEYLKEITGFNLETRYDDYKFTFYKKATKEFTTKWIVICEEIYQWLIKKMQTNLNKKTIKEVEIYKQLLKDARVNFDSLIVFGSQAKGNSKPHSDIDLCVVSKDFGKDRYSERVKLMLISNDDTIDIEPHPYHPDDLSDRWDSLASEIRKYGLSVS